MIVGLRSSIGATTLAAVLIAGCGSPASSAAPVNARVEAARPTTPVVRAFSLTTTDGRSLAVPAAKNPTVVFFMAAWCISCVQGARDLARLHADYANRGLRVIAVDVDQHETSEDLARFRELAGDPPYDWALDAGGKVTQSLAIRSLDATLLIGPQGEVLFRSESLPNPNALRRAVQLALGF